MPKKTISGARAKGGQRSNGCNPRHNNRDYLPSNADPERQNLNAFFVESTKSITIEDIYEKLFQASYKEWLDKEHAKGRQTDAPEKYIDKIRNSSDNKREQYEIIWQFGDMKNTGWNTNRVDFMRSRALLNDFAEYLLSQPNITVVTPERLADPSWKPPFEDGLVITNMALHADENTPHIQMDFIPYTRSKKRGQRIQNAYAAAFEGMGYKVVQEHATDPKTGELRYKRDKDGNFLLDKAGQKIPVMRKVSFGSIDWIEEQKGWLQHEMEQRYGWEREYKGKNKFGDVSISQFVAEDNLQQAAAAEQQRQRAEAEVNAMAAQKSRLMGEVGKMEMQRSEEQAALMMISAQLDQTRESMKTSLKSKAEYDAVIDHLKGKGSPMRAFYNAVHRFIAVVKDARSTRQEIVDAAFSMLKPFPPLYQMLANAFGYENRTNMPEEERQAPALVDDVDKLIAGASYKSAQSSSGSRQSRQTDELVK